MSTLLKKGFHAILLAGAITAMFSCNHDRNHPGWSYMPDMYYSEPYDAYTPNPNFTDSLTMQLPVPGSIARGTIPYPYKARSFEDQVRAGQELQNPITVTPEVLDSGKALYEIFCNSCHGPEGKGDGHLYTSQLFPAKPTSLIEPYVQGKPDGEIFHVITTGSLSGLMGAHGSQIRPEERWHIILYVRALAGSQNPATL
jgi:mono/diheme cytochrome c family protein